MGCLNDALGYGANAFMFYTGAPQNTMRYAINKKLTEEACLKMKENGIDINNVVVHAPYIVNLANRKEEDKYKFSIRFLKEEMERCSLLGIRYIVLHPGSHVGEGIEVGIKNIIDALNEILDSDHNVTILLETMAGKGSEIGSTFLELQKIIDGVKYKDKIGVCLDTCHLSDSGYNVDNFEELLDDFDKIIGLSYIRCVHINDSKNECGAKKDRHENIGYGNLGFNTLLEVIYSERLVSVPKILETPWIGEKAPYKEEIEMIIKKEFDENIKIRLSN